VAKRITSTVVLWLLLFAVLWFFRTDGAVAVVVAISVLTLRELYRRWTRPATPPSAAWG
jgi:phosphatidate cytidylyltransferase